jgi:hypothetical protein
MSDDHPATRIRQHKGPDGTNTFSLPAGHSLHPVKSATGDELRRLAAFDWDIRRALDWLAAAQSMQGTARDGLYSAALISFVRCFEKPERAGRDQRRPLSQKLIFDRSLRPKFEDLVFVRNKLVAHDEQLYGFLAPGVVRGPDLRALDTVIVKGSVVLSAMPQAEHLKSLATVTYDWLKEEQERLRCIATDEFNALSMEERARAPILGIASKQLSGIRP